MPANITTTTVAKVTGPVTVGALRDVVKSIEGLPSETKVAIRHETGSQHDPYDETTFTFTYWTIKEALDA